MAIVIPLVQGDTKPTLSITLVDENKNDEPVNITGATARLVIRELDIPGITDILTGVIVNASEGKILFPFNPDSLINAGDFEGEVELTYSGGDVHTSFDKVYLAVREQH